MKEKKSIRGFIEKFLISFLHNFFLIFIICWVYILNASAQQVPEILFTQKKDSIPEDSFSGNSGKFSDERDGETYTWVKIGNTIWMAENLKAVIYNDGVQIPNVKPGNIWKRLQTGAYCWYDNEKNNKDKFGALYNWYAVNSNKLCPTGWHVPSDEEWIELETYLGGNKVAGGKMKSVKGFGKPNEAANNSSGFSAVAGGYCQSSGAFRYDIYEGYWWSATEESSDYALFRYLSFEVAGIDRGKIGKKSGLSVRCIKN